MAAMGAKPIFYNLSLSIPKFKASQFIPKFAKGLQDDQEIFDIKLIGGDLTSSLKHINVTITIFGKTSNGKSIPRDGAKIGDCLYVSGILGLSKIGLDFGSENSNCLSITSTRRGISTNLTESFGTSTGKTFIL